MPDLMTLPANTGPRLANPREVFASAFVLPRAEQAPSDGPSWLFDYTAFLSEQQDHYCQAS
jgi:hypothetical protein